MSIIAPSGTDYKACLATGHHTEVCTLSRQGMFHPLSDPLQASIRFFRDPLPTEVSEALARFLVWVCEAGTPTTQVLLAFVAIAQEQDENGETARTKNQKG
ncbi:MAG TPA: hypothetical protein VIR76_06950 [Pusillimonas sp.]